MRPVDPVRVVKCSLDDIPWRWQLANTSAQEAKHEVLLKAAKDEVLEHVLEVWRFLRQVKEELDQQLDVHLRNQEQMILNQERMIRNQERKEEHMLQSMKLLWSILGLLALLVLLVLLAVLFEKFFMRARHPHVDSDRASSVAGSYAETIRSSGIQSGWGSTHGQTMSSADQTSRVAGSPSVESMASSNIETVNSGVAAPATISSARTPSAVTIGSLYVDSPASFPTPSVESWISTAATATSSAGPTSVGTILAHDESAGTQNSFVQVALDAQV